MLRIDFRFCAVALLIALPLGCGPAAKTTEKPVEMAPAGDPGGMMPKEKGKMPIIAPKS